MTASTSLRTRITRSAFAMTFVICLLFTTGIFFAFEIAEESLFEEFLESDLNTFMDQYALYPGVASLPRSNFNVYISENGDLSTVPDYITRGLPDVDDIELDGRHLDLEIRQRDDTTFYFVIEETDMDLFELILVTSVLLIVIVICITSIFLARTFSNTIIRPVTDLANRVNSLERDTADGVELSGGGGDELQVLSEAIDSFRQRVADLLRREREFSSDASHELRTPLMGIQAAAENLQVSSDDSTRVTELAGRIEARCRYMRSLVEAMLFLARDPHSLENDFSEIDLIDVVNDQIEAASPHIEGKGVEITVIESESPAIFTTEAILAIVFGNLLRNAVIHSESSSIHVDLSANGFHIKDFGSGISAEMLDRMFERYTNGNSDSNQGMGIGLSLVKRLCDHFGWDLRVDSTPGAGTTISVDFTGSVRTRKS